jgi:hypothetical protein
MLFNSCPLLQRFADNHEEAFNTFLKYKTRVPVCGAIMLNDTLDKVMVVIYLHRVLLELNRPVGSVSLSRDGSHRQDGASQKERSTKMNHRRRVRFVRLVPSGC